ncbi:MAG TPA: hypothetical protein VHE35_35395, partial [Kofleriaceae bacterium]|nr:hypothetical protein [Kofleriaceae bacterium]
EAGAGLRAALVGGGGDQRAAAEDERPAAIEVGGQRAGRVRPAEAIREANELASRERLAIGGGILTGHSPM